MNLNQVTVPVSNVEKSIGFYELLGLKLIVKALPYYARFECPEGNSTFSIQLNTDLQRGSDIWIYFEVRELDKYVQQLVDRGIQFEELPNEKTWLWRESKLKDPDNHQIIIYFAGDNRKYPPWRISQ
jgi:catechol 2,3-dioxygenase-like lactoylglutathione lyase family enzyme